MVINVHRMTRLIRDGYRQEPDSRRFVDPPLPPPPAQCLFASIVLIGKENGGARVMMGGKQGDKGPGSGAGMVN